MSDAFSLGPSPVGGGEGTGPFSRRGGESGSLLWPPGARREQTPILDPDCVRDLGLAELIVALSPDANDRRAIEPVFLQLCQDPDVIRYRQDILADLLAQPGLAARLAALMPKLRSLSRSRYRGGRERGTLEEVLWRLGELESFVESVDALRAALEEVAPALRSAGLVALRGTMTRITADETFQSLVRELPDLLAQVRTTASVTIGVNLDHHLQPVAVTLLSINDRPFRGSSWLSRLFGAPSGAAAGASSGEWEGIAPLHAAPDQIGVGSHAVPVSSGSTSGFTPMMVPLFRDLARILEKAAQPVARALKRYVEINTTELDALSQALPFYLGAARLVATLRGRGLPLCRPELAGMEDRICEVTGCYNINLALRQAVADPALNLGRTIVPNDVFFGPAGRVIILTGPNQGGKTTFLQGIGLIQVLAQAGLYVPGTAARISPVDGIYSHFPVEEKLEQGTGRFGDEARRLHDIFGRVTRHGLVLLNETLSSTSAGEGLYLGQDLARVLRLLGARAIFSTHLHELAAGVEELNASEPGDSRIVSMVASPAVEGSPDATDRRYKIVFGPPLGRSYAREIAGRFGVSYEQLRGLLADRGLVPGE